MNSHRILGRSRFAAAVVGVCLAAIVAACGGAASGPASGPGGGFVGTGGSAAATAGPAPAADAAAPEGAAKGVEAVAQVPSDMLIIKTGSLDLRVADLNAALAQASARITGLGGYASASQRQGDAENATASVTYRIPAERWDDALVALRALADKVLDESTQTADVTGQVLDLGARISNLQASEQALRAIMARATEIKDVLSVQTELTNVRGQIEELATEKKHLEEQAAFSTLAVSYVLKPDPVVTAQQGFDPNSEIEHASGSLVEVLQALATAGIWLVIVWLPILVGLAIVAVIGLAIARRLLALLPQRPVEPKPTQG
jgi:hypothetical protein